VLAIVLRQRIAEIGLSEFCLSFLRLLAPFTPLSSRPVTYESGVERRVASNIEHKADNAMETAIII
jgi:hypothetical protein